MRDLAFNLVGHAIPEETLDAIRRRYQAELETRLAVALATGCRLAVRALDESRLGFVHRLPDASDIAQMTWEFVLLGPGEKPEDPGPWTIYEFHGDRAVGRSA
jgi:hypothetical protein